MNSLKKLLRLAGKRDVEIYRNGRYPTAHLIVRNSNGLNVDASSVRRTLEAAAKHCIRQLEGGKK